MYTQSTLLKGHLFKMDTLVNRHLQFVPDFFYSPFVNWLSLRWASLLDGHLQLVRTVQMVSVLTELTEDIA